MAEISASIVQKLRKISGQGMMDCKKALEESGCDMEKALEILRKKGLATLAKRAERETTEGLVVSKKTNDGRTASLATLCCETDFVTKSDDFIAAADKLADYTLVCRQDEEAENILNTALNGKPFSDIVTEVASKTGEKIQVGDFARFSHDGRGLVGIYIHFNGKVGAMVEIETSDENVAASDAIKTVASDIAMHITAAKPIALDKNSVDQKTIETEKAIYAEQVKNKPPQIIEKIVEGKLQKFFAENCLLQQQFVKDDSKTVAKLLDEAAKQAGGNAKITKYVRFAVG
jgi:elongation factor Ts